ncbi:MAG: alpha/beta fold hydrolase [Deferrisomatales bacterium]
MAAVIRRTLSSLGPHGFHRVAYTEWGDPAASRAVVCVHGLTRTGRDFDTLAAALAPAARVACPDLPGRGASDWLRFPADYGYPLYLADLAALLARLGVDEVDWVGTSLGGLLGMMLAAQPGTPVRRLVLNDVGPWIPRSALERIAAYVGADPRFASVAELERYLRQVHAPFGPLTDAQWRHLAETSARRVGDGWALHYDPAIAQPLRAASLADVDLWALWGAVGCPVLVLRGADSDLLTAEVAAEMVRRRPGTRLAEFAGVGHAPALVSDGQVGAVLDWLAGTAGSVGLASP